MFSMVHHGFRWGGRVVRHRSAFADSFHQDLCLLTLIGFSKQLGVNAKHMVSQIARRLGLAPVVETSLST